MSTARAHPCPRQPHAQKTVATRACFAARLSPEQKALFEQAAALHNQSLSQFVISSAERAAEQVIREHEVLTLSARDSRALMEALLHPEPPGPWLRQAVERYKKFMGEGKEPDDV
jgi:uncharacterized protein (DUF1778 family)